MGFSINGKGYVGCGYSSSGGLSDFWEYDPATDIWTQKSDYPITGTWAGCAFAIGNKGYFTLGTSGGGFVYDQSLYEYDPNNNAWTMKSPCPGGGRQDG